jgi:hypothetical protein
VESKVVNIPSIPWIFPGPQSTHFANQYPHLCADRPLNNQCESQKISRTNKLQVSIMQKNIQQKKKKNKYIHLKRKILRNVQRIMCTSWQDEKIIIPKKNAQVSLKDIL